MYNIYTMKEYSVKSGEGWGCGVCRLKRPPDADTPHPVPFLRVAIFIRETSATDLIPSMIYCTLCNNRSIRPWPVYSPTPTARLTPIHSLKKRRAGAVQCGTMTTNRALSAVIHTTRRPVLSTYTQIAAFIVRLSRRGTSTI